MAYIQDSTSCLLSDSLIIILKDCIANCFVQIPTTFSPNSSIGLNDFYRIITNCDEGFSEFEFSIFNRWGEIVYGTIDPASGLDGLFKNSNAEISIYTYAVEFKKNASTKSEQLNGNVRLIR
ncbi:MAG: gliding motility-associated-like protein [Chitinophagales bacterium]